MKKYVKPMMECEEFVSNEYCATCYAYIGENTVISRYYPTDGKCDNDSTASVGGNCSNDWISPGFEDDGFDLLAGNEDVCAKVNGQQLKGWYYAPGVGNNNPGFNLGGPYQGKTGTYGNGAKHNGQTHMAKSYFIKIQEITKENHTQYNCGPNAS